MYQTHLIYRREARLKEAAKAGNQARVGRFLYIIYVYRIEQVHACKC